MIDEEIANVSANIPGTGQNPVGKPAGFGDTIVNPGAAKRWKKINATQSGGILRRKKPLMEETFAGAVVFEVSSHTFHNAKMEKRKGKHWRTYLDECDELAEIREYANKNPSKPIVLQNRTTSEMVYVRYGKKI
jgi:hypothetical protein